MDAARPDWNQRSTGCPEQAHRGTWGTSKCVTAGGGALEEHGGFQEGVDRLA